jgi:Flp pilus assembly protein CpaB
MEAHRYSLNAGSSGRSLLANRRNSVIIAVLSAIVAGVLIYLFVSHYKKTPPPAAPVMTTVWEAKQLIPQGTPASAIAANGLLKPVQVPVGQVGVGAIPSPAAITSEVTTQAISAGQQVLSSEFTKPLTAFAGSLGANQRAVAFSFDTEHGLTSYLQAGNDVDVMDLSGAGQSTLIAQNIPVLANTGGIVVLRLTDRQALLVTAATGKGSLWLSLRPSIKAKDSIQVGAVGS